jgi:DNA-binding transcriptional ArsR family regulator
MDNLQLSMLISKSKGVADILKSFAHEKRLLILCFLSEGERNVSELEELCKISQSQLSQFLTRLHLEGHINFNRKGTRKFFFIEKEDTKRLIYSIKDIYCNLEM